MRSTLAQMGQGACPCGALCLPKWGTLLAPNGHKHWQNSAQMIYEINTFVKECNNKRQNRLLSVENA